MNQHTSTRSLRTLRAACFLVLFGLPAVSSMGQGSIAPGAPGQAGGTPPHTPTALPCSINAACWAVASWAEAISATVRIVRTNGSTCTGVLVNNTRQDEKPYVLTARHCGDPSVGDVVDWTFEFNYQSPTCENPAQTPVPLSLSGAVVRAAKSGRADFALLELLDRVPASFNVFFAGWTLDNTPPSMGVAVGHPRGDIKKLAIDVDPFGDAIDSWQGAFDLGTIETGSSGSPLFNGMGQLVGHLRSAVSLSNTCSGPGGDDNQAVVLFPKLSYIWGLGRTGKRVRDFLDPDNLGYTSLPALRATGAPPAPITLTLKRVFRKANGKKKAKVKWNPSDVSTSNVDVYVDDVLVETTVNDGVHKVTVTNPGDGPFAIHICEQQAGPACSNRVYADFTNALTVVDEDDDEDDAATAEGAGKGGSLDSSEAPGRFAVWGNYPNPFNPTTAIRFDLPESALVRVDVVDLLGRRVMALPARRIEAGAGRTVDVDASPLPSGTYLYRVIATSSTGVMVETGRMTLVK